MRSRRRDVAVSAFVVLHVAALVWWNLGVVEYRSGPPMPGDAAIERTREAVAWVDRGGLARAALTAYVRATGLWQSWVLFGPDVPHETGRVELLGVAGFDREGRPVVDPTPLRTSDDPTITERTQIIGNPPCGWARDDRPLGVFLRASWARWHARQAPQRYVGAQLVCRVRPVAGGEETTELLWAGPLDEGPR